MFEKSLIFLHRLKTLCDADDLMIALKFSSCATHYYEKCIMNIEGNHIYFPEDHFECIRDIYYLLLVHFGHPVIKKIVRLFGVFYLITNGYL